MPLLETSDHNSEMTGEPGSVHPKLVEVAQDIFMSEHADKHVTSISNNVVFSI